VKRKRFKQAAALLTATAALVNMATPALAKSDVTYTGTDGQTEYVQKDVEVLNTAIELAEQKYQNDGQVCTVTVTEDETVAQTVEIHDSVTLDLNGHEVTLDPAATTEETPVIAVCAPAPEEVQNDAQTASQSETAEPQKEIAVTITSTATETDADGNTTVQNGIVTGGTGSGILVDLSGDASYDVTIEHVTVEGNKAETGGGISIIGEPVSPAAPAEDANETASETVSETTDGQLNGNETKSTTETTSETTDSQLNGNESDVSTETLTETVSTQLSQQPGNALAETVSEPVSLVREETEPQPAAEPDDQVTIRDCVIQTNTATQNGGGVAVQGDVAVQIESSTITHNTAAQNGGGIYSADSDVTLVEATVTQNTALNGGGIAIEGGSLTLQDGQSVTCVADNYALPYDIGQGDDLYLAPSQSGASATVTLNEANGILYPGLDIAVTDWYVDGALNGEATPRWLDKYDEVNYWLTIYSASKSDSDSESESGSEAKPAQTIGTPIEITGTLALKAAYDGITLDGSTSGVSMREETFPNANQTNSGASGIGSGSGGGGFGGGSFEEESTASRLASLGGRGRGNIRQELPIGQHGGMPIVRPVSSPITRPQSGITQASGSGSHSIRPASAKTGTTGTRPKAPRTGDDLPFAVGTWALCCALLRKKCHALRHILLHK
jgi:predicted outer membrane repeat protein